MTMTKKNVNKRINKIKIKKQSNTIIMDIIKHYGNLFQNDIKNKKLFSLLYNSIEIASKEANKITHEEQITSISQIDLKPSYFLDKSIVNNLIKKIDNLYRCNFLIKECNFTVKIYFNYNDRFKINNMIKFIKILLCFCLQYYENQKQVLNYSINLYLGDDKKGFSSGFTNMIESKNINSGFYYHDPTVNVSNIVIFRKEEWFKTLIHECVHCFNLDFQASKICFKSLFSDTFFLETIMMVNEAITEFWARTINVAIVTYFGLENKNLKNFSELYTINLNIERMFSIYQSYKILKLFGLRYENIINKDRETINKKIYHEKTNAFCYYVLTSLLMFEYNKTMDWFTDNKYESNIFKKTEREFMIFCYFLKQVAKKEELLSIFNHVESNDIRYKSLKMCAFELDI